MTYNEYTNNRNQLMQAWETECRQWLAERNKPAGKTATFFKDGIIDPATWFDETNTFRPLFILKEVNDHNSQGCLTFDYVDMCCENGHDIWNAVKRWRRLAVLSEGLRTYVKNNGLLLSYSNLYSAFFYKETQDYHHALRHIAVINIKKMGGGDSVNSSKSKDTLVFTEHAKKFKDSKLKEQITNQIQPNIIFFCGAGVKQCFEIVENKLYGIPTIEIPHPSSRKSNKSFYDDTLEKIKTIYNKQE